MSSRLCSNLKTHTLNSISDYDFNAACGIVLFRVRGHAVVKPRGVQIRCFEQSLEMIGCRYDVENSEIFCRGEMLKGKTYGQWLKGMVGYDLRLCLCSTLQAEGRSDPIDFELVLCHGNNRGEGVTCSQVIAVLDEGLNTA